jgi:hypothetical protein
LLAHSLAFSHTALRTWMALGIWPDGAGFSSLREY